MAPLSHNTTTRSSLAPVPAQYELSQLRRLCFTSGNSRLQWLINGIPLSPDNLWSKICDRARNSKASYWDMSDTVQYFPQEELSIPNLKTMRLIHDISSLQADEA